MSTRNWIVDGKGIASKVKNAGLPFNDCGANLECPNCHYLISNNTTDVCHQWPGFPAGVKFDPSDTELLDHLAAKCRLGNSTAHVFIDEFISTVEREEGICYSHPEDLPGVKKDGSSVHFFHRTINAYSTGQRKRRKVSSSEDQTSNSIVRWHKTGKTKPILENGMQKGCKKIMVLYGSCKKGFKPDKCNWVMHQYHLGTDEDEIEGQYVVSKIFYQQSKIPHQLVPIGDPSTPIATVPSPPRPRKPDQNVPNPKEEIEDNNNINTCLAGESQVDDDTIYDNNNTCLAGESQVDDDTIYDALLFDENSILDHYALEKFGDLDNLQLETPPDFHLGDLPVFGSQDSIFGWLDNL